MWKHISKHCGWKHLTDKLDRADLEAVFWTIIVFLCLAFFEFYLGALTSGDIFRYVVDFFNEVWLFISGLGNMFLAYVEYIKSFSR